MIGNTSLKEPMCTDMHWPYLITFPSTLRLISPPSPLKNIAVASQFIADFHAHLM